MMGDVTLVTLAGGSAESGLGAVSRLHRCFHSSSAPPVADTARYARTTYDAVGNRLRQRTEQGSTRYRYDAADELVRARGPRLNERYSYDLNGNQTRKGSTRYTYDLENELTELTDGGSQVSYTYS